MNKRLVIKILIFFLIVFVGDRIIGGLIERLFLKTGFRYAELYQGKLPGEIAILGNSRGLHMFHPPSIKSVTGREVSNLAFNGLPTATIPIIWEDYLAHHATPEMLILEVSCVGIADAVGAREQLSILIDQNPEYADVIGRGNAKFFYATKLSRLFRYNTPLLLRSAMFLKKSDQSWIMDSQLNEEAMKQAVEESDATLIRSEENVNAFRRVLETAKKHGVKVKLVLAPYHPDYLKRLADIENWLVWLETELGQKIENHSALISERESFADHLHMHEKGAVLLAERLDSIEFFGRKKSSGIND